MLIFVSSYSTIVNCRKAMLLRSQKSNCWDSCEPQRRFLYVLSCFWCFYYDFSDLIVVCSTFFFIVVIELCDCVHDCVHSAVSCMSWCSCAVRACFGVVFVVDACSDRVSSYCLCSRCAPSIRACGLRAKHHSVKNQIIGITIYNHNHGNNSPGSYAFNRISLIIPIITLFLA